MRPLKITMSGFGPYAEKTVLDMEQLGREGLYLITGDTGAGKTTIFDAIVYVLYGVASGEFREPDMFRSKYAKVDTPTYVEMEFTYREQVYVIWRNPEYKRPAKRGEKEVLQKADAWIKGEGEFMVVGMKNVTQEVEKILNLTVQQFTQITMIAQGEFMRLLMASTKDRSQIFREIFHTKPYMEIQEQLKKKSSELKAEYEKLSRSISQYVQGIQCAQESPSYERIETIKEEEMVIDVNEVLEEIFSIQRQDEEQKKLLKDKIEGQTLEIELMSKKIGQTEAALALQKKYEVAKVELEVIKDSLKEIEEKKKKNHILVERREDLKIIVHTLGEKILVCKEYKKIQEQERKCEEEYKCACQDQESHKKNQAALKLELDKMKKELEGLEEIEQEQHRLDLVKRELEQIQKEYDKILALEEELKQKQKSYEMKLQEYLKEKERYSESEEQYNVKENQYFDNQAGILAGRLEEGKPCLVCGSMVHPKKARQEENTLSKDELEALKVALEKERTTLNRKSQEAGEEKVRIDVLTSSLQIESQKWLFGQSIKEKIQELKLRSEQWENEQAQFLQKQKRKTLLTQQIEKDGNKLEWFSEKEKEDAVKVVSILGEIEGIKNQRKIYEERFQEIDQEEAMKEEQQSKKELNEIEATIEEIQTHYDKINMQKISLESQITTWKNQVQDTKQEVYEDLVERLNQKKTIQDELQEAEKIVSIRLNANEIARKAIEEQQKHITLVAEKWKWIRALSNTANANLSGKERVLLETYIQSTYFERVLSKANVRFMKMSSGQYELKRKETGTNYRSQSGLELDIIDHYNGSIRSVKSLSGGESFKASLSLALGLADEIQMSAGGIKIDTLFIDEGFGSLDEESLKQAIDTLQGLSSGNRLVGIISHVAELKERIEKQIVVKKQKEGSSSVSVLV